MTDPGQAAAAIRAGDVDTLAGLLRAAPDLARTRVTTTRNGHAEGRTLLHVATDWPAHRPNVATSIRLLAEAGADVDARFEGFHAETPLHWAASADDVVAIDALVTAGANVDSDGAVIAGGTPLDDAVAFGQWAAAARLAELGARTAVWHAAALGMLERVAAHLSGAQPLPAVHPWGDPAQPPRELDVAVWCAASGGRLAVARLLVERGADPRWVAPWDGSSIADAARRGGAPDVVAWLDLATWGTP
ncbi:MAG: ankyrin repeat domain-containing protein [Pseudonocardia sp.]|nr:ankyrin repeat domain-containing protein [Pseudonocardia sp.]